MKMKYFDTVVCTSHQKLPHSIAKPRYNSFCVAQSAELSMREEVCFVIRSLILFSENLEQVDSFDKFRSCNWT